MHGISAAIATLPSIMDPHVQQPQQRVETHIHVNATEVANYRNIILIMKIRCGYTCGDYPGYLPNTNHCQNEAFYDNIASDG